MQPEGHSITSSLIRTQQLGLHTVVSAGHAVSFRLHSSVQLPVMQSAQYDLQLLFAGMQLMVWSSVVMWVIATPRTMHYRGAALQRCCFTEVLLYRGAALQRCCITEVLHYRGAACILHKLPSPEQLSLSLDLHILSQTV